MTRGTTPDIVATLKDVNMDDIESLYVTIKEIFHFQELGKRH